MKKLRAPLCWILTLVMLIGAIAVCSSGALAMDANDGKTFTVTFALEDGKVIRSYQVPYGETPVYNGPTTTRDDYFDYKLTGWTPEIVPAKEDATYYPVYIRSLRTDEGAKSRLRGDANGDGEVNILDATTIQRYLVGFNNDPYGIIHVLGACDGQEVTILDATRIQRYLAGIENPFRIGEVIGSVTEPVTEPATEPATEAPTEPPTAAPTVVPSTAPTDPYELPPV